MRLLVTLAQHVEVADLPAELDELPPNDSRRMAAEWERLQAHYFPDGDPPRPAGRLRIISWVEAVGPRQR
jgi:hypothetical protein